MRRTDSDRLREGMSGTGDPTTDLVFSLLGTRPAVPAGIDWADALRVIRRIGLGGLAVAAHRAGALLPTEVADVLEPDYLLGGLHTSIVVRSARRARSVLAGADVPALLYKGAALVEDGTYPDPGARRMDDADLLVPAEKADRAVRALCAAGYRPWSEWDPGRMRWLDSVCLSDLEAEAGDLPVTIDLHWRVQYGSMRFGDVRGREILWDGAETSHGFPAPETHLPILCEHVLKHLRVLVHFPGLADVARVSERVTDWASVAEWGRAHPFGGAFGGLFELVHRRVGVPIPREVRELGRNPLGRRLVRRALEPVELVRRGAPSGRLRGLLQRFLLLSGSPGAVARDVLRATFPDRAWLRARYRAPEASGIRLHLRYWSDLLRWAANRGRSPVSPNQEMPG